MNQIYFVTWGHIPSWLNLSHPKLKVVRHEEFIPTDYLPTFSSHPIELNLHRIKGLSERFVYFNDDTFLIRPVLQEDFFKNGLPRDCCIETAIAQDNIDDPFAHILLNNTALVNMHFKKREGIKKKLEKMVQSCIRKNDFSECSDASLSGVFRIQIYPYAKSFFEIY